jgi:hypothetical protein
LTLHYSGFLKCFPVESRVLGRRFGPDWISPSSPQNLKLAFCPGDYFKNFHPTT